MAKRIGLIMTKKVRVFSTEVAVQDMIEAGMTMDAIEFFNTAWMEICEGLTEKEMKALGYLTHPDWLVEVEEE